ncbi:MAG: site-specific integrase [Candidatus Sedimenticola sp. (ex Thyasira tokunagai)]
MRNHKEWELDLPPCAPEESERLALAHEHMAQQYRQAIATRDFSIVEETALSLLSEQDITVPDTLLNPLAIQPEGSEEILKLYRRVARELSDAKAYFFDALAERNRGITGYSIVSPLTGSAIDTDAAPLLSALWESYSHSKQVKGEWKEATRCGQNATYNELIGVIGDVPANEVNRDSILSFLEALQQLPKGSLKRYKGKSVGELLDMDIAMQDRRSSRTVSEALGRISSFFKWCHKQEQAIPTNPTDGISFSSRSIHRDPFTATDIEKLFYSQEYKERSHRKSWQFWMPLLALYTGARQNELAQLTLKDIIEVDGIPAIDINDTELGQSIKTDAGFRQVPIHEALIAAGFLDYVSTLRSKGGDRLFPDLTRGTRRWGQAVSQWWNREDEHSKGYMVKCGVDKAGGRKVFHSFRNTVITQLLREARIPLNEVQFLVGHETSLMGATGNYYRGSFNDSVGVIKQLDFGLDHLFLQGHWKSYT